MKLGPVNKRDKRNKTTSKKFDDDVITETCDIIASLLIHCQFGAIWKPDSEHIVCKTHIISQQSACGSTTRKPTLLIV